MDDEIIRDPGWFEYFESNDEEIKLPKSKISNEGISLIVETPEYLRKKEEERLEEERRKEEERRELEHQKKLKRLEEKRKKQEEKERLERELLERRKEEERRRLEEERKIEEMRNKVNESLLDDNNWREIPFCKSVRVSKNGKIMQVICTEEKEVGEIIPVAMCFNRMRKQLEVDLSEKENEEKIYSVQELMAIVWLDYTPEKGKRVILKDGKPLHLELDNIDFENIEE